MESEWLKDDDPVALELIAGGESRDGIKAMLSGQQPMVTRPLKYWLDQSNMPEPSPSGQIHVLVKVPSKRQTIEEAPDSWMRVLSEEQVGVLPSNDMALRLHFERELRVKIPILPGFLQTIIETDKQARCAEVIQKLFIEKTAASPWRRWGLYVTRLPR